VWIREILSYFNGKKRPIGDAERIVRWLAAGRCKESQFWAKNVRSPNGLRRHWERLLPLAVNRDISDNAADYEAEGDWL
jgi:hypothetical protein